MRKFAKRTFAFILTLSLVITVVPMSFISANPASDATVAERGTFEGRSGASWRLYSDGTLVVDSGFIEWNSWHSPWYDNEDAITSIIFRGPITAGYSLAGLFADLSNVTAIEGLAYFDTSNVITMEGMFSGLSVLTSLDLSNWDTSNVEDMGGMFSYMSSLTSLNLSGWDTGSVVLMDGMFYEASALTSLDLSHFNTANVEDMGFIFYGASALTSLDLSGWNTSNVMLMDWLFYDASALTSLDLSSWNTSNVIDMGGMFGGTGSLRELILGENFRFTSYTGLTDIGGWRNARTGAVLTSEQLTETFVGATMHGSWVWQQRVSVTRNITVTFGATLYYLDGEAFTQQTMVYNGVAYLPAAYLARRLGLTARWDAATNTTTLTSTGNPPLQSDAAVPTAAPVTRSITATFGATLYYLDGEAFTQQTMVYNGVAYLPAAYLARRLGLTARWDAATNTTTLTSR